MGVGLLSSSSETDINPGDKCKGSPYHMLDFRMICPYEQV